MRIELLQGSLAVAENPGLDSTDPRFDAIATLMQQGDYAGAASGSEAVIAEGIYDIRLLSYFLYGHLLERGLAALGEVVSCAQGLLEDNWEAVGPAHKREKNVQNSLGWLFRQILKNLQYQEGKQSPEWQAWQARVSAEDVEAVLDMGDPLRRTLIERLDEASGPLLDAWGKIQEWLRGFQKLVYRPPEPEPAVESAPEPEVADTRSEGDRVEGSYHLSQLLKKLEAFEQLIEQQKFPQAALVADDINATLANFDPKLFFPKLFGRYTRLLAVNIGELVAYADQRDTVEWQAMQELLKVDIDGFVNL